MSHLLHLTDKFGNDMWFGDTGQVRLAALTNVDYSKILEKIRHLPLRNDDVFVVGFPKSGNNWIHHIITMLLEGTTELPPFDTNSFYFVDGFGGDCVPSPPDKPRALMSHLPFRFLPEEVREKKVKVVYLTRNPKDIFVSLYCHMSRLNAPLGYGGSWTHFFEVMLEQGFWYGDVFEHLKEWEKAIDYNPDHPIFHCNYEETKNNPLQQIEKLNKFLGTNRSRDLCDAIAMTCTVKNMHATRTFVEAGRNPFGWKKGFSNNNMWRKGTIGDWKNWFTVAQNEKFDKVYNAKMAGYSRKFQFE